MQENYELPVERITDEEIACAIRYLDPDHPIAEIDRDHSDAVLVMCVSLIVLLIGALAYAWLYLRTS